MLRARAWFPDDTTRSDLTEADIPALLATDGCTLWVDLTLLPEDARAIERLLMDVFRFHPLAVDDALRETHVPRIDDWGQYLYIVLHNVRFDPDSRRIATPELDVFLSRRFIVTIHRAPLAAIDTVWDAAGRDVRRVVNGTDNLLYQIADLVVAEYMPLVDQLDDWIDEIETEIFTRFSPSTLNRILRQKRRLVHLRRSLSALREVLNKLARDDYVVIDAADRVYFRDVYDHTVRLFDIVESMRDLVGGALDTYLSVASNRTNEVMKALTVTSVIFMPISFLASFFGMNFFADEFAIHPGQSTGWLFWGCVTLTVLIPPAMFGWMKYRRWF